VGEAQLLGALRHLPGMRRRRKLNAEVHVPLPDCARFTAGEATSLYSACASMSRLRWSGCKPEARCAPPP
jgi:hypothetical protein